MGLGNSGEKTDRGAQLGARTGLWNVFNYSLPQGQNMQSSATSTLGGAENYWHNLLSAGRTQTAQNAAPAIQAQLAQGDAARRAEGVMGTSRVGGTNAINREAGAGTSRGIDDLISQTMTGGRAMAASGLQTDAQIKFADAANLLGLGTRSVEDIIQNATNSRLISNQINQQTQAQIGQTVGMLLGAIP
jgi:hypothetical protein